MQYVLWAVSFVTLWLSILWLSIAFFREDKPKKTKSLQTATIVVPVYNGEQGILRTLQSLKELDYPKRLLQIIVVDDASTDTTAKKVQEFIRKNKDLTVTIITHPSNKGKGAAVNTALAHTKGDFFAEIDCDSRVHPAALILSIGHFTSSNIGAVISSIKVDMPKTYIEKLQRIEYIMSDLVRQLLAKMNMLFFTHGVLCVFKTRILKKIGGFDGDRKNITEDLEIALRLRSKGYSIQMSPESIGHTFVPNTFNKLWRQRVRWFRGFIFNHIKYRYMIGNSQYGLFGMFQLPLNLISVLLLLVTMIFVSYGLVDTWWTFVARSLTIDGYFLNHVFEFSSLKEFLIGQNIQVILPIMLGSVFGLWILFIAHQRMKEKLLRHSFHIWLYFIAAPYITCMHWMASISHELLKTKRKW